MPLLIGATQVEPDPEQFVQPVSSEDVGTMTATWTDPSGQVWNLTDISPDVGWFTLNGPAGWGATPIDIITDPLARGGEQVRTVRVSSRTIQWPLHIYGDTHQEFTNRYRALTRAFTSTTYTQTPGILTVSRPDGRSRMIYAYYKAGFEGEDGENWLSANPVLNLWCPDGYWLDTEDTVVSRTQPAASNFYSPYFTVGSSQVLGFTSITNPGDVDAWPRWVVTGPMTKLTGISLTLGVQFSLTYTLTAGQQVRLTTNRITARGPGDINLSGALNWPDAVLWPLVAGENLVQFQVDGAGPGSRVDLAFRARHEGA